MYAVTRFIETSAVAANAAAEYINYLQGQIVKVDNEYLRLLAFSGEQDALIEKFLFDRNFALQYARYGWILNPVDDRFASDLANAYLEIAALSPHQQNQSRNPEFTGNPNIRFDARLNTQNSIPPLPSSSGNGNGAITMEQYLIAQEQGRAGAARAAAMANPANLYASLFQ